MIEFIIGMLTGLVLGAYVAYDTIDKTTQGDK